MPFDDDDFEPDKKGNIKKVSSQKSIFETKDKKPNQADLEKKINQMLEKQEDYKSQVAKLALDFKKLLADKTLPENKSIIAKSVESDIVSQMIKLGIDINNDEKEQEGMGSMGWILILLKTCLYQRDRLNELEFALDTMQKKINLLQVDKKNING